MGIFDQFPEMGGSAVDRLNNANLASWEGTTHHRPLDLSAERPKSAFSLIAIADRDARAR